MKNKFISIITVTILLVALLSSSMCASALVDKSIYYGDIDGNGVVDTIDARAVLMAAAGLKAIKDSDALKRADINNDGIITLFDARQVLRGVSGLVSLQPDGAFFGFKSTTNGIKIESPEAAMVVFNTCLNRVKKEKPGFTRSEATDVSDFDIDNVNLVGISLGNSVDSVKQLINEKIITESEPEEAQIIVKGTDCYNAMSVETKEYVSLLTEKDVCGIEVTSDAEGYYTINVALPDGELDNLSQTAYAKAFNTDLINEKADSVLASVLGSNTSEDAKTKTAKNAVLTLVFDTAGNVVSYTTTYETDILLATASFGVSGRLSAELTGLRYTTKVTVTYDDFQW